MGKIALNLSKYIIYMTENHRAIGIFNNHLDTETALKELDKSHFSLDQVFVIAHNTAQENEIIGKIDLCDSLRDRFNTRISSLAKQDSGNVEDEAVISLTEALTHLDIPVDIAQFYNNLVAEGKYLVMVEGSQADISGAKTILKRCGVQDWVVYKIVLEHPEVIIVDRRNFA
jgi:hypothetical protein